jgi:hypothetical protein
VNLTKAILFSALIGGLTILSGCNDEEPVAAYSVPKEPAKPAQSTAAAAPRQGGSVPQWTVPAGWKPLPASGMRFAAFAITDDTPPVTLTVIPLPSSPLLANVNRWEGELGLPHSNEAGLDKVVQHIDANGAHIDLVDLTGPESPDKPRQRMLAALIENQGKTWFFKAVGPAEKMAAQKDNFENLLKSVKFGDAPAVADAPAPSQTLQPPQQQSQQAPKAGLTAWTKPQAWRQDEKPRAMRELTFFAGPDDAPAEVIVSRMGGSFGGLLANINRWRQQVGLGPVSSEKDQPATMMQFDGGAAALFDMSGSGANGKAMRQIVVMTPRKDGVWFFKILGPSETVEKQKPTFDEFLKSVKFAAPAAAEK